MTRRQLLLQSALALVSTVVIVGIGVYVYNEWNHRRQGEAKEPSDQHADEHEHGKLDGTMPAKLSPEARKNLGITAKPLQPTAYYRKIDVPGVVADRPGVSDRGVTAPVTGVVTAIHAYPGHTVSPGDALFSLRLVSDSLHTSQLELFKATKEIELAQQQKERVEGLAQSGGVARSRLIEIESQIQRMEVNVQAYRQDLAARGLPADRIDAVAKGKFITEIVVRAPQPSDLAVANAATDDAGSESETVPLLFEVETLKVELGQYVDAGTVLCHLADHRALLIEGRGFKKDLGLIHQAAKEKLPIEVLPEGSEGAEWPPVSELHVGHVANRMDATSRTFAFYLPLENQWQAYEEHGEERFLWRFRPGDRLRLRIAVEKIENVFVLPQGAVVREGPEAFVFRQNGDLFDRIAVHVLHEDSTSIVIANDGKLRKSAYIAQNGAASINRVLKAQLASGQPTNVHVHADGTVHGNH